MTRRTPEEKAVRQQVREQDGAGDRATAAEVEGAAARDAAASGRVSDGKAPEAEETTEAPEEGAAPEPEPDRDPPAKAEAERDEYLELARRTQADFENYRKRAAKDMSAAGERAKVGLVRELLPVVDNLERALQSAGDDSSLAEGVRLVLSELQGVLSRNGVEPIEPSGEQFDPTVHEALSTRAADGAEPGIVLDVVEKGYRMSDTVVRPARVVVSA